MIFTFCHFRNINIHIIHMKFHVSHPICQCMDAQLWTPQNVPRFRYNWASVYAFD